MFETRFLDNSLYMYIVVRNRWIMINATINQFLTKQLPNLKIAVIGDVMVDRYVLVM